MKYIVRFWLVLSWARQQCIAFLAIALACYAALGVVIRLTIKDAVPFLATVYYAAPLPAVTFATLFAGLLWLLLRKPRRAWLSLAVGMVCAWWTFQHTYVTNPNRSDNSDRCVMFWNMSSGRLGWSRMVTVLNSQSPDVIGLVECGRNDADAMIRWQEAFPDYEVTESLGGILLLSKFKIISDVYGSLGNSGQYKHVTIETNAGNLHVFVVDIKSDPLMPRREPLEEFAEVTAALGDQPILVMGDFNTPADSVHFDALRRTFDNAFEARGCGYSPTWPVPVPVLHLDHIWTNRHVVVSQCKAEWTLSSDHRPVTAWLHVAP